MSGGRRRLWRCDRCNEEDPASRPAGEGSSGVASGRKKLRYHIQREEAPTSRRAGGEVITSHRGRQEERPWGHDRRGDALAPRRRKLQHRDRQAEKASASYLRKEAPASRPAGGEALVSRPARRRSCVVTDRRRGPGIGTGARMLRRRDRREKRPPAFSASRHRCHDPQEEKASASRSAQGGSGVATGGRRRIQHCALLEEKPRRRDLREEQSQHRE